jgi:hypothetical protein
MVRREADSDERFSGAI